MRKSNWTPSIVPAGEDQNVYMLVDDLGRLGRIWPEMNLESIDLETVIADLLTGRYNNPIQVVSFNIAEGWARDLSEDVAQELRRPCGLQLSEVPASVFVAARTVRSPTAEIAAGLDSYFQRRLERR
jgi:hypothetical protein